MAAGCAPQGMVARESARRLARLGGSEPQLEAPHPGGRVILLDTSVWVEHLRSQEQSVADLLEQGDPLVHPWVIGELACENLNRRAEVLAILGNLPSSMVASEAEFLHAIDAHGLMERGIGCVDAGLITSCLLSGCRLWTLDRRLAAVAGSMGLAWCPPG